MAGLACLLLSGSLSHAQTVAHWRFGDDGGFLNDSSPNNHDLTMLPGETGNAGDATQEPIPVSGPGSTFDDAIAGNTQLAAYAPGDNFGDGFEVPDHSDFSLTDFTIEALIHRPDANCLPGAGNCTGVNLWHVAGQYNTRFDFGGSNDRSWKFQILEVTNNNGIAGHPSLTLAEQGNGSANQEVVSDFFLDNDKDWYVAVSFDLSNKTDGVTFYVKDLASGDPMQIDKKSHSRTSLFDATGPFSVGRHITPSRPQQDGFVDEVRLSNVVLDPSALLVPVVVGVDGDFDGDLDVDGADFLKWQRDSGDAAELALWETNFGTTAAAAAAVTVPEPASWVLICTMTLAAARWRRRS